MKKIAAVLFVLTAGAAQAAPALEMRFVVPCKEGDHAYALVGSGEELCLGADRVIANADVERIQRVPTRNIINIDITKAGSDRLWDVTYDKVGERMGLVFNDRLIAAPMIGAAVRTRTIELILNNDPDDVEPLVTAFPGKDA
jgi:hypothetical protein